MGGKKTNFQMASETDLLNISHYFVCTTFLAYWGRVMHMCISKITIIVSYNGLLPGRHQAIIWTNAGIWLSWLIWTNMSEIYSAIHTFSFKKMHLKMSSAQWRKFCFSLYVLKGNLKSSNATVEAKDRYICICVSILIVIEDTVCIYHTSYQQNRKQAFP